MKNASLGLISCVLIAFVPAACAAEEEANPPAQPEETQSSESGGFNFAIPGDDSSADSSGGFNFSGPTGETESKTALGDVDLPVDESVKIETFEPELAIPAGEETVSN